MAVIETWLNQDLQKPVKVQYIDGSLFSNNGNGNRIGVVVTDNGEPVTISGTVSGYVVVSDGSTVPCTGAKSGNRASILIPPAAYVPGSAFISLFITDGTTVTTLAAVSTTVLQTRTGTQVDPGSVVTDWTQTINGAMQDVQTAAANLGSIVATPYASLTYPVPLGKYTYYDGGLYRCISPIASSEAFTPAHWTAVKLGDDVSDLKSATDNEIRTIKAVPVGDMFIRRMSFTDGTWLNNNNNFKHFAYPIDPGDIVHVKCSGGASSYAVVTDYSPVSGSSVPFSSAEGYTSSKSLPNSGTTFTAPNDAKYLLVMVVTNGVNRSISEFTLNGYDLMKSVAGNYVALKSEMETADSTERSNRIAERTEIDGYIPGAIGASDFTSTTLYKTDGTTTTASTRTNTDFIPCDGVEKISFKLIGTTNPALALVSFFDASKNFIGCIPATNGSSVEKADIYIPSTAKYLRGTFQTSVTWTPYIYLYKENSEIGDVDNKVAEIESKTFSEVDLNPKFTNPFIWYSNGTSGILSQRGSSEFVKCDKFDYIIYKLQAFSGSTPITNVISFFTDDMTYISGVAINSNDTVEGIAKVPTNAVYCCGSFLQSTIQNIYMKGATGNNTQKEICDLNAITDNVLQTVPEIVNQTMTKKEFLTAVNAKWTEYAALCLCWEGSFRVLPADTWSLYTWDQIHEMINENFRWDVWKEGMSYDLFCKRVNLAFTMRIRRFEDAVLNNSTVCDFSLKFTERSGEPSAIVSKDGSTLYLYAYQKRFATQDGVTWSEPESVVYDTNQLRPEHYNCNLIDGVYYIIGRDNGWGGAGNDLRLWTSTDGINFTFRGILLPMGYEFVSGDAVTGWGNSYLIKQNGTWFLYIEYTTPTTFWEFSLVTCTDLFHVNQDGTIGNWTNYSGNPIMGSHIFSTVNLNASGNPDFAKGEDNRPIRVDGKWYMYFHCTYNSDMYLMRAYSYDLYQWTIEGRLFDNRDIPTDGHGTSANADQAIIEFKGRTYLFYTYDINTTYTPYIHYMIDDRPIREILKLYP